VPACNYAHCSPTTFSFSTGRTVATPRVILDVRHAVCTTQTRHCSTLPDRNTRLHTCHSDGVLLNAVGGLRANAAIPTPHHRTLLHYRSPALPATRRFAPRTRFYRFRLPSLLPDSDLVHARLLMVTGTTVVPVLPVGRKDTCLTRFACLTGPVPTACLPAAPRRTQRSPPYHLPVD